MKKLPYTIEDFEDFLAQDLNAAAGNQKDKQGCPVGRWLFSKALSNYSVNAHTVTIDRARYELPKVFQDFIQDYDHVAGHPSARQALRILHRSMETLE